MDTTKTALVLGATGGIGGEMVRQLLAAGWQVRALMRGETPSPRGDNIEWLRGDALSRTDVLAAA
ncbi:short chain dehydrogenase [compost metagenome]